MFHEYLTKYFADHTSDKRNYSCRMARKQCIGKQNRLPLAQDTVAYPCLKTLTSGTA